MSLLLALGGVEWLSWPSPTEEEENYHLLYLVYDDDYYLDRLFDPYSDFDQIISIQDNQIDDIPPDPEDDWVQDRLYDLVYDIDHITTILDDQIDYIPPHDEDDWVRDRLEDVISAAAGIDAYPQIYDPWEEIYDIDEDQWLYLQPDEVTAGEIVDVYYDLRDDWEEVLDEFEDLDIIFPILDQEIHFKPIMAAMGRMGHLGGLS